MIALYEDDDSLSLTDKVEDALASSKSVERETFSFFSPDFALTYLRSEKKEEKHFKLQFLFILH